jgi:hypothetical protein
MAQDRDEVVVYRGKLGSVGLRYLVCEIIAVDTDDTVTLGEMHVITAGSAWRLDTGAALTCTVATNVVTVTTAALSNVPVVIVAFGS